MAERLKQPESSTADQLVRRWLDVEPDESGAWLGLQPGPTVAELGSRISALPRDFLAEGVDVTALAGDVLGIGPDARLAEVLRSAHSAAASRQGLAVGLWIYAAEDVIGPLSHPLLRTDPARMLAGLSFRLAAVVDPYRWLVEADRREEAARATLLWSRQHPGDEDYPSAYSRWAALDSLSRDRALQTTMADYLHRQEVMRQLQQQRAREAAARYTPE